MLNIFETGLALQKWTYAELHVLLLISQMSHLLGPENRKQKG